MSTTSPSSSVPSSVRPAVNAPGRSAPAASRARASLGSFIGRAAPNALVVTLLAGVFYFGHRTGWKMPSVSELSGASAAASDDWCTTHLVAESRCIECREELEPRPEPLGFCRPHGVSECVIHHPERAQVKGAPRLPAYDTVAAIEQLPRSTNNSRNTLHLRRVQFDSAEAIDKSGVAVDVVQERPMSDVLTANGQLRFDPTRVAHLSSPAAGRAVAVFKTLGDNVQQGETLALIDADIVGKTKSRLAESLVQQRLHQAAVERLRPLARRGAVPEKSLIEAEAELERSRVAVGSARQTLENLGFRLPESLDVIEPQRLTDELRFLGISSPLIRSLADDIRSANLVPIRAPQSGTVVASELVTGEIVDPGRSLYTVADAEQLWLELEIRSEDASLVTLGLPVRFSTEDGNESLEGTISWISPVISAQRRTFHARVVVANPDRRFRDGTFGTGTIILREEPQAIVVPREAVQSTPDAHFVFVRDKDHFEEGSPKYFHVRQVRIGARDDHYVELLAGVLPGEVVATTGSPVLMGQLLRSAFGAGCGCHP